MGTLTIVPGGLSLILTAVTTPAGDNVDLYDDPAMVISDPDADPGPIVGDEITLPLAVTTDTTLYGHDGPLALTITHADGTTLFAGQVVLSSGIGSEVTTVAPAATLVQVAADVYADRTADTTAFAAKATLTTKGDIYAATAASTPARLATGTTDQVLTVKTNETTGLVWATPDIRNETLTAKGALLSASAASTPAVLAVGTDGKVLTASSGETTGLVWAGGLATAAPVADSIVAAVGVGTTYARADHSHPRERWTPADHALLTWPYDPSLTPTSTAIPTAGLVYVTRVHLSVAANITNIITHVGTAGNTLTSGQCFAGLYQAGVLLGATADQSTAWASTGVKTMAVAGGPVAAAAGDVLIAFFFNGTTGPALPRSADRALANIGLSAANSRYATADAAQTTAFQGTLGTLTASTLTYWLALS
jgi:hypothetical protein